MTKSEAVQRLAQAQTMAVDYIAEYRPTEEHTSLEIKAFCNMCDIMKEIFVVIEDLNRPYWETDFVDWGEEK